MSVLLTSLHDMLEQNQPNPFKRPESQVCTAKHSLAIMSLWGGHRLLITANDLMVTSQDFQHAELLATKVYDW